jgi:hypothetical protein
MHKNMSRSSRSQKRFTETTRNVWARLFGIFVRRAREASILPLDGVACLAGMTPGEWLVMEAGRLPDPAQLDLIAAVLGLTPEQTEKAVRIYRLAWTA